MPIVHAVVASSGVAQRSLSAEKRTEGRETMQTRPYYLWQGLTGVL
jgi:hypothetical protein